MLRIALDCSSITDFQQSTAIRIAKKFRNLHIGISFNFFVCFIFNVSLGSAPKRKNFDIQCNTRVASGRQFTLNYHTPSLRQAVLCLCCSTKNWQSKSSALTNYDRTTFQNNPVSIIFKKYCQET